MLVDIDQSVERRDDHLDEGPFVGPYGERRLKGFERQPAQIGIAFDQTAISIQGGWLLFHVSLIRPAGDRSSLTLRRALDHIFSVPQAPLPPHSMIKHVASEIT